MVVGYQPSIGSAFIIEGVVKLSKQIPDRIKNSLNFTDTKLSLCVFVILSQESFFSVNMLNTYNSFHKKSHSSSKTINDNNFTYGFHIKVVKNAISSRKNVSILDYGCGIGTIDFYFANHGHNITGIDISPLAIETANQTLRSLKLQKNCKFKELNKWKKGKSSQYDMILCFEVLEHVQNDRKLIEMFFNLIKIEGILILSTPSENAPLYKLGLTKKFDREVGHLRRYSINRLSSIIEKSGFKIVDVVKNEGILRNSLFLLKPVNFLVKFVKGPVRPIFNFMDKVFMAIFGESDLLVIAQKI